MDTGFISVIVPLKLEWEPVYAVAGKNVAVGDRVTVNFAGKEYVAVVSGVDARPMTAIEKVRDIGEVLELPKVSKEEIRLWRKVADYYMCTVGEVYKMAYPVQKKAEADWKRIGSLNERILKRREMLARAKKDRIIERLNTEIGELEDEISALRGISPVMKADAQTGHEPADVSLTPAQSQAYGAVKEAFSAGKPTLLQGVTGSGKTEIYTKLAQETMKRGKNVLYLVPEIALSRQLEERLEKYFPGKLLVYHSGLTSAERQRVMKAVEHKPDGSRERRNEYILLGTRSALFLPHHDLGLVIVDEEHDSSYKQDSPAPRYNGRDVALMLAAEHHCNILLGSATPSFESLYNCACGRFRQVALNERFHGDGSTDVVLIDTNAERKKRGMVGSISRKLIGLLKDTFEAGGQAMILRARKSYATTVQCSECGAIIKCPHCNVSLNLQKSRGRLVCNHCGYTTAWSEHIPHLRPEVSGASGIIHGSAHATEPPAAGGTRQMCNGRLVAFGAGTEKIEEELKSIFPERTVVRLDSDTSAKAGWQKKVLKDFADRKIDILLGTQILTKGFDFDNLSLVAVLQADSLLGQQDFRADEKAMQILEQFRGRCSRRGQKGTFVIQTAQPEHPVYQMLQHEAQSPVQDSADVESANAESSRSKCAQFQTPPTASVYRRELLEERRVFHYPPYTRIINIILRDKKPERLDRLAGTLSLMLRGAGTFPGKGVEVTTPFAPAVDKLRDEYIRIIRISLPKDRSLSSNKSVLGKLIKSFATERKYDSHITIDVDPS